MMSGTNNASMLMIGCRATAAINDGCENAKAVPSTVMMTLRNTRPYVRRTSVARSAPERIATDGAYEKPMVPIDSVGVYLPSEIYPASQGACPEKRVGARSRGETY